MTERPGDAPLAVLLTPSKPSVSTAPATEEASAR